MNSEKFKKDFKKEYVDFFRKNCKVFSMPLLLNWASDINEEYKGLHVKQKIPLRIYLGINKIKSKNIVFNKINYFDINEDIFIKEKIVHYSPILSELHDFFNNEYNSKNKFDHGLEFNVLAEGGKGQGSGFFSILSTLFIIGFKNNYKGSYLNIDEKIAKKGDKIMDIINDDNFYNDLLKTTLKLNKFLDRPISNINQICSIFNSKYPIVSYEQQNINNSNLDNITFFGYKINELSENMPKIPYIPLDYGLIYTGMPVSASQILFSNKHKYKKENKVLKNIKTFFEKDIKKLNDDNKPFFYKIFLNQNVIKNDVFIEVYLKLMGIISFKILNNLVNFYKEPYEEYLSKKFLENVNKISRFNLLTKKSSNHYKSFIQYMTNNFKNYYLDLAIAPNDTMLMGGNAIFAMKVEGNRAELLNAIKKINSSKPGVKLVYSNWLDGLETKGLIIEQDLTSNKYSQFINKNNLFLIDSNGKKTIIGNDYLEKENSYNGLFLDLTKNKVFLNGKKLTSKELKSQNTTIEVLLKLLENKGDFISNKDLTASSYSSNKSDMFSKIISPLQKLIKEENNIDFIINIDGTMSNFRLKLEESLLDINIIRYIENN